MFLRVFLIVLLCGCARAEQWMPIGPEGGDVRSLAYDPNDPDHVFLGTSSGTIFDSPDAGRHWVRLAHVGAQTSYVVDHIVVDPRDSAHIYAAVWSLESHRAGELFASFDSGKNWKVTPAMRGKSVRAVCLAPSDPEVIVIGALDGVFRSKDGGRQWQKISRPPYVIRNVESIAIDPDNAEVIYAGTWHLAWKTTDGGMTWHRVREGVIDDSDVFSILLDHSDSRIVFASACSGIYKSSDAGRHFEKIENIPFSARRTRILRQAPDNPAVIYAGTTEGLWVTKDAGATWERVTDPDLVVNDILIDPRGSGRVLLATDRGGVFASDSQNLPFTPTNSGFTHRYVSSILADRTTPDTLYVGIVNDRERGGVFVSGDAGRHWDQRSDGLNGTDVFALAQVDDGSIIAGTNRGLFKLSQAETVWRPLTSITAATPGKPVGGQDRLRDTMPMLKINDIQLTPHAWFAATSAGLYVSDDQGSSWRRDVTIAPIYMVSVKAERDTIVVATPGKIFASMDRGKKWVRRRLPPYIKEIQNLALTTDGQIVLASHSGAFRGPKLGAHWERARGLPHGKFSQVIYDNANHNLLMASDETPAIFGSSDSGISWQRVAEAGYEFRRISIICGRLVGATLFDGVLVQSRDEVDSRVQTQECSVK